MIWDIISKKIEDAGLATTGENLFLDEMLSQVVVGIMIKSPLAGIRLDHHLPGYYTPDIQLIVRHNDAIEGARMAATLMKTLTVHSPEKYEATSDRGAAQVNLFLPKTLPIRYPRLTGDLIEWSCNFQTSFVFHDQ